MFNYVSERFSSFELNSCLINIYPDNKSFMPDNSDDEQIIDSNSFIVTLSLGSECIMHFKNKHNNCPYCKLETFGRFDFDHIIILYILNLQEVGFR